MYLARDSKSRSQLACKLVNLDKVQRKNASEQLQRKLQEVDILRQLQHVSLRPLLRRPLCTARKSLVLVKELTTASPTFSHMLIQSSHLTHCLLVSTLGLTTLG